MVLGKPEKRLREWKDMVKWSIYVGLLRNQGLMSSEE
jgi:hypothetical protein